MGCFSSPQRTTNGLWDGSTWLTQSRFTYDDASRIGTVSDGTRSATYSYLANSLLVEQIEFKESTTTRMTATKSYDFLNRLVNGS